MVQFFNISLKNKFQLRIYIYIKGLEAQIMTGPASE